MSAPKCIGVGGPECPCGPCVIAALEPCMEGFDYEGWCQDMGICFECGTSDPDGHCTKCQVLAKGRVN